MGILLFVITDVVGFSYIYLICNAQVWYRGGPLVEMWHRISAVAMVLVIVAWQLWALYKAIKHLAKPVSPKLGDRLLTASSYGNVFKSWEILRIPYNCTLGLSTMFVMYLYVDSFICLSQLLLWAIPANMLFLFGPIVESCAVRLGLRTKKLRFSLWILGTMFSLMLAKNIANEVLTLHCMNVWGDPPHP